MSEQDCDRGGKALDHICRVWSRHYNEERLHSSRDHLAPGEATTVRLNDIVCTSKLGGVIHSYSRRAAERRRSDLNPTVTRNYARDERAYFESDPPQSGPPGWADSARTWRSFAGRAISGGRVLHSPSDGWTRQSASGPNSGAHSETRPGAQAAGFPNMQQGRESPPEPRDAIRLNDVVCESRLGGVLKSYSRRAA